MDLDGLEYLFFHSSLSEKDHKIQEFQPFPKSTDIVRMKVTT